METVGDFLQINGFRLEGSPQAFDEDVVEIAASTIQRGFDVSVGQSRDPASACILPALVRIHYLWLAISGDSHFQSLNAKAGIQHIGKPPGQNLTGRPIIDCHQIHKAVLDGDVGDVAALNLIGPRDCELSQQVWIDPRLRMLFADIWSLVPSHACKHALPGSEWSAIQ